MADQLETKTPGTPASPGPTPVTPSNGNAGPTPNTPPSPPAAVTAPKHRGLRGGRKRADGLIPGSPEALEADRKKERERKQITRAQERQADPPPIPPATGPVQTPGGPVVPVPGLAPDAPIPWDPKALEPLVEQIVAVSEELTVTQITDKAKKALLPGEIIHDLEKTAAWNPMAKKAIGIAAPQVAAKWLNKTGVSAEHQPEIVLGTALASIALGHMKMMKRMDELIKKANPPVQAEKKDSAKPA